MFKRCLSILVLIALTFNGFVFAEKVDDPLKVTMKDSNTQISGSYYPVDIVMAGEEVQVDVPAILYQMAGSTRTLVPVRFISENLGATVKWDGEKQEVSIFYNNKLITLVIDDPIAYVNDVPYALPNSVPPKLMNYMGINRTLVPLRFVSDQLGMDVGWISATRTATIDKPFQRISSISFDKSTNAPQVIINTTGEVAATSYMIKGSDVGAENKLIVDIPNAQLSLGSGAIVDSQGVAYMGIYQDGINAIRAEQVSTSPYKVRLTIDLEYSQGYELIKENNRIRLQLINSVVNVHTENIYGAETVIVQTVEEPKYNVKSWNGKVIVDIIDSKLKLNQGQASNFQVGKGGIDYVSYSQLDPTEEYEPGDTVSRVVVTLNDQASLENVYIEHIDTNLYIYVAGNPLNTFDYAKDGIDQSHLSMTALYNTTMKTNYDKTSRLLTLRLPINAIGLSEFTERLDDNLIERMNVTSTDTEYVINLTLENNVEYTNLTPPGTTDTFVLTFKNSTLKYDTYLSKLIVIDPGHGGKDPGAVNQNTGDKEKDFNLVLSLKLKKKLENIGFKVYMTRDYDTYIGLSDRANIANDLGANALISVHINSSDSSAPSGVSVLYNGSNYGSKSFATMLLTKLMSFLPSAINKGIVDRPNLVVIREAKMPSALAELGFLSNNNDLTSLKDEVYQDKLVEGLYQGIIQFLK